MDNLTSFMRAHVLGIDIKSSYCSEYLLKNYINLNQALQACGHETTELAKAISDCQEAIKNMHDTAVKARQHFDHVGLQGKGCKQWDYSEKDKLT